MWLPDETFKSIIQHTPLISIDLLVRDEKGQVLLGKRVNAPAKGYWFVPGGRVCKNETLDDAFGNESGIIRADVKFLEVFEHFYEVNVFDEEVSTDYVVLAYSIVLDRKKNIPVINIKHESFKWFYIKDFKKQSSIHDYSLNYFK